MSDSAPRCPSCANVLKMEPTFWERIGLRSSKVRCPSCHVNCDPRDADMMGAAFFHWAEAVRGDLITALDTLPVVAEDALIRVLGAPHQLDTRLSSAIDELVRSCMRHQRPILIELARGREATLEVAHLLDPVNNTPEAVAILGTTCPESGSKELQQIIGRSTTTHYVLYNFPGKKAEQRVREAMELKARSRHAGTTHAGRANGIGTTSAHHA